MNSKNKKALSSVNSENKENQNKFTKKKYDFTIDDILTKILESRK